MAPFMYIVKNFENRIIFDEVKAYKTGAIFSPPCKFIVNK